MCGSQNTEFVKSMIKYLSKIEPVLTAFIAQVELISLDYPWISIQPIPILERNVAQNILKLSWD